MEERVAFASGNRQCHIGQLLSYTCCVPCTVPGAVYVLSLLSLRRRILRDEKLVPREIVHLGRGKLGFASLLTASPVSARGSHTGPAETSVLAFSQCRKPGGSSLLLDFGSFVLQLSAVPQL